MLGATPHERQLTQWGLSVIRRSFEGGRHYFIANHSEKDFERWVPLGQEANSVLILDPITGKSGVAAFRHGDMGAEIYLQLAPGESVILRTFADKKVEGPAWT